MLPGPNLFFLRFAVAAPEISPLLGFVSAIALVLALFERPTKGLISLLLVTLLLCSLPSIQRPKAIAAANQSMADAFNQSNQVSAPFRWQSFFGGFENEAVRTRRNITFKSPAGRPLSLDLYQPLQPGRYPAVVTIYGGSWMRGSPAESQQMAQFLAARGYVVAALDYRHAPEYRFPAQVEDIAAGLAFLQRQADEFEIKRDRIALLGWSAGAHLAMLLGLQPELQSGESVRSIVNYYGPVDLENGYYDIPHPDPIDVRQVLRNFIGGTPADFSAAYNAASPLTYVKQAEANTLPDMLLIYGRRDHVVESRFGKSLYDALQTSGNRAVWIEIPWAEHAFDKLFSGVSNQMALPFIEQFLAQTLQQ
ncbi:MAG: alpha/beta hydrolase [Cyanobacteria bacterium P01_D01_bin.105]